MSKHIRFGSFNEMGAGHVTAAMPRRPWLKELIDAASKEAVAEIRKALGSKFHDPGSVELKGFRETIRDANAAKMQLAIDRWVDDGGPCPE